MQQRPGLIQWMKPIFHAGMTSWLATEHARPLVSFSGGGKPNAPSATLATFALAYAFVKSPKEAMLRTNHRSVRLPHLEYLQRCISRSPGADNIPTDSLWRGKYLYIMSRCHYGRWFGGRFKVDPLSGMALGATEPRSVIRK